MNEQTNLFLQNLIFFSFPSAPKPGKLQYEIDQTCNAQNVKPLKDAFFLEDLWQHYYNTDYRKKAVGRN